MFLTVFIPCLTFYSQKVFSEKNLDELRPVIVELISCPDGDSDLAKAQAYFRDNCREVIDKAKFERISYVFLRGEVRTNQYMSHKRKQRIQNYINVSYRHNIIWDQCDSELRMACMYNAFSGVKTI